MQVWVLTRFEDVHAVLRDHEHFSSERTRANHPIVQQMEAYRLASGPIGRSPTMLSLDPPAHTRMRKLVNKAFTPRVVNQIRPRIKAIAEEILTSLPQRFDLIEDFGVPLPVRVISEVLGVPAEDREQFKLWSRDIAGGLAGPFQSPDLLDRAQLSSNQIADYFREQIAIRRAEPGQDLLSALAAAEDQGDLLSEDELLATCILLLVAGNETTTNLIGNGALALLQNPVAMERLRAEPALLPSAVEEMLRFDGPAQMTSRIVVADLTYEGKQLQAGQVVLTVLAAANRDPTVFDNPDRFDIERDHARHLAFGHGIHYCLGASLALAEAEVAFETLLAHAPHLVGAFDAPDWGQSFILRGLASLQVSAA